MQGMSFPALMTHSPGRRPIWGPTSSVRNSPGMARGRRNENGSIPGLLGQGEGCSPPTRAGDAGFQGVPRMDAECRRWFPTDAVEFTLSHLERGAPEVAIMTQDVRPSRRQFLASTGAIVVAGSVGRDLNSQEPDQEGTLELEARVREQAKIYSKLLLADPPRWEEVRARSLRLLKDVTALVERY